MESRPATHSDSDDELAQLTVRVIFCREEKTHTHDVAPMVAPGTSRGESEQERGGAGSLCPSRFFSSDLRLPTPTPTEIRNMIRNLYPYSYPLEQDS